MQCDPELDEPDDEPDEPTRDNAWSKKQIGNMAPDEWWRWHTARRAARSRT